ITATQAYQRTSTGGTDAKKEDPHVFARMPVRGLSPEQLFDSLAEATEYQQEPMAPNQRVFFDGRPATPRQQFIGKFTSQDKRIEWQTSILQALFMMNGKFIADATSLERNKTLNTIATAPTSVERRVETLYLVALSRPPRPDEMARVVRYVNSGGPTGDSRRALADVFWALLNSAEFMLNH